MGIGGTTDLVSDLTERRICLASAAVIGTGFDIICVGKKSETVVVDSFCDNTRDFRWSVRDTDISIAQAKEHNAVRKALCGEEKR